MVARLSQLLLGDIPLESKREVESDLEEREAEDGQR